VGASAGAYAAYYEAIIKASENHVNYLPACRKCGNASSRYVRWCPEVPTGRAGWEIFHAQLVETDTRLRLASLRFSFGTQARKPLCRPGSQKSALNTLILLRACQCCGVLPNTNSIASAEIDWMMEEIRPSILACPPWWDRY
jgi:hypothetical protein